MARFANGRVHFSDGSYATVTELDNAGETVTGLSEGLSVFSRNGKSFQSDGTTQTAASSSILSVLSTLESRKGTFMPGIEAAR